MQVLGVMQDQEWFVFPEVNKKILEYVTEWIESLEGYFAFRLRKICVLLEPALDLY